MTMEIWTALWSCVGDSYDIGGADAYERDMLYTWLEENKPSED